MDWVTAAMLAAMLDGSAAADYLTQRAVVGSTFWATGFMVRAGLQAVGQWLRGD